MNRFAIIILYILLIETSLFSLSVGAKQRLGLSAKRERRASPLSFETKRASPLLFGEETEGQIDNAGSSSPQKRSLASPDAKRIIADIQYKCDGAFPALEVQRVTKLKKGEVYSRYKQRRSVEEIYKLGHFAQVEVDKEETPEGILITFLLTNKVTIKNIETIGNRDIKDDEILNVIKSKEDEEYDASRKGKYGKLIEELYKRRGYFNVEVRPLQTKLNEAKKEAILKFSIEEGKRATIKKIVFRGNRSVEKEELLDQLKTRQGNKYDYQVLDKDIDGLRKFYKDKGYLTVEIDEPQLKPVENQVEILINITEGAKITVEFKGRDNIKDEELKKVLTLYKTNDYSDSTLRRCVADIENLYTKKGYYNARVTKDKPEEVPRKGFREVVITFHIEEGNLFSIKAIRFEGNEAFSDKQLRSQMSTKPRSRFALPGLKWLFSRGIFDKETFEEMDLRTLRLIYKKHGYHEVKISSREDTQDDKITITINIDEGPKSSVKEVKFENSKGESEEEIFERLGGDIRNKLVTQPGEPYNQDNILTDTAFLRSKYYERGHIYVQITPEFDKGVVTFHLDEGKRARMGKLDEDTFIGNKKTEYYVLKREFTLKPGDVYNRTELAKTRQRLLALGLFSSVDFTEEIGSGEQGSSIPIDVTVRVNERYAGSIGLRGGYSPSEERIRSTFEVGYNNLFRRAWRINTKLRAEWDVETFDRAYEYEIALSEPRLFSVPILLPKGFRTGPIIRVFRDNLEEQKDTEEQKDAMAEGGTVSLTFSGGQRSNLAWQYEYKKIDLKEGGTIVSSIGLSYRRDVRNDFLYPDGGWLNHFSAEYAGGPFGGESNFYKLTTDNRYYRKISGAVLALAARAGYAEVLRSTKEIVSPERFRTGGSTTIRGYKNWSVGPEDDPEGDVLFLVNAELRFPIYEFGRAPYKFGGAFFYDTGNVWDKINISDIPDLRLSSSFGFGFRLNTPIGPIRLDYGFPVDSSKGTGELWLELGHAF